MTMCMGGGARAPAPPPRAPEAPRAPDASDGENTAERDARRRRKGSGGTILTGSGGVQDSGATAQKTLLGQ